ncbi:MAG: ABC transporter substrate-binding protein [Proteobacteria bacterium]|nr:ABC transporter substrate-binding protein [Pseudomonadota bacterium]
MASRPFPLFLAAGLVLCLCWPLPPAAAAEEAPSDIVGRLNAVLMEVMQQADELGFSGRYDRLAPVLSEAFNFPLMARISVGRHWRKLENSDRDRLVDAFGRMSIATFAARFDGYSGERFEVLGENPAPRKAILVRNRLIKSDGEAVEINYLLKTAEGRWRVVDVFLDAKYSELAMKRSEYGSVIKNAGFDELIRRLDEKIADLAEEG